MCEVTCLTQSRCVLLSEEDSAEDEGLDYDSTSSEEGTRASRSLAGCADNVLA